MPSGTTIERLFLSLGLDMTQFETDLAGASKAVNQAANKLNRDMRLDKMRMEIELLGMKDAENSIKGMTTKLSYLDNQLTSQKAKVDILNHSYQESVRQLGENAKASQNLQERLVREQLAQAKLTDAIRQTNTARNDKVKENIGTGMNAVAGIASPVAAAASEALHLAVDSTEYENMWKESMGKMEQEGRAWSESLRKELGVNEYELRRQAGTFNVMFNSMGMGTQKSYELATGLTKLTLDMSSFYHVPIAEMNEKIVSGMVGMSRPLEMIGILVKEQNVNNYAYSHGIAQFGQELTDQQQVLARYGTIMEQTNRAQGDLARTSDSSANHMRLLKGQVEEVGIEFGKTLIPALDGMLDKGTSLVKWYQESDSETKNLTNDIVKTTAAIGSMAVPMMALNMIGIPLNPWVALVSVISLATLGLVDHIEKVQQLKELEESRSLGEDPDKDHAKVRKGKWSGDIEKEILVDDPAVAPWVKNPPKIKQWVKIYGEELDEYYKDLNRHETMEARRKQLESIVEASTGKPLTKDQIDEKIKDEFDEQYSTDKWTKNSQRDQEDANKKKALEEEEIKRRLKANTDLNAEISKLRDSDFQNEMHSLSDKYKELQKSKVDEVKLAEWAELAKKEVVNKAQKEYLSDLDKMRQAQISNASAMNQVGAIKDGIQNTVSGNSLTSGSVNLQALENQQIAFNLLEKQSNSTRLSERLSIIQQMLQAEETGTRRRKELLMQEVAASGEYTKSIIDGVKSAKQEIESLQSKSMSAASQAMSSLEKYFPKENNYTFYKELAKDNEDAWDASSTHTMAQLNQEMEFIAQLEKAGVRSNVKITSGDFKDTYRDSIKGIPESIAQAQTSMASFYSQINDLGKSMTQNYFDEWRQNLNKLKNDIGGGFQGAGNTNYNYAPARMPERQISQADLNLLANGYKSEGLQGIAVSGLSDQIAKLSQSIQLIGGVSGNGLAVTTNNAATRQTSNTFNISTSLNATTNNQVDADKLADTVAGTILTTIKQYVNTGADEYAY